MRKKLHIGDRAWKEVRLVGTKCVQQETPHKKGIRCRLSNNNEGKRDTLPPENSLRLRRHVKARQIGTTPGERKHSGRREKRGT